MEISLFFQAEDGIRDRDVTGVQTCALPISQESLADIERYALGLLIDLARIPPVEDPSVDVVRLLVVERDGAAPDLRTCVARDWYLERGDGTVSLPRPVLRRIGAVATPRPGWRR